MYSTRQYKTYQVVSPHTTCRGRFGAVSALAIVIEEEEFNQWWARLLPAPCLTAALAKNQTRRTGTVVTVGLYMQ